MVEHRFDLADTWVRFPQIAPQIQNCLFSRHEINAKLLISLIPKRLKTDEIDETGADPQTTSTSYEKPLDPTRVMGIDI